MYDVSFVTTALVDLLTGVLGNNAVWGTTPPFTFAVSAQHPTDVPKTGVDCDINLYLFHVVEDRNLLNSFWTQQAISNQPPGPAKQPIAYEPLCLDLYYLLTANSQLTYLNEQQAMSVCMRAFHENPIVRLATPTPTWPGDPGPQPTSEITLTMERPTWQELSQLWQALECPMRMTTEYRASVVMLNPEQGLLSPYKVYRYYSLLSAPAAANDGATPELYGTIREVNYMPPSGAAVNYDQTPASVGPGQEFTIRGIWLQSADTVELQTLNPDGSAASSTPISAWVVPLTNPYPSTPTTGVPLQLKMPTTGALPAPGRYVVQTSGAAGVSNHVPLSVAPWIDPTPGPTLLPGAGGSYSFDTLGVPATGAELRLGTVALSQGTLAPGFWTLSGQTIEFIPPVGLPSDTYAIRLRAADVEADPALWVSL